MERNHRHGFSRRINFINTEDVESPQTDGQEQLVDGDDLLKSFSSLFNSMRLFGIYFTRAPRRIRDISISTTETTDLAVQRKWNRGRIYALVVMVATWINAVRILTMFDRKDKFGYVLFLKLATISVAFFTAMLSTALFVGCQTGKLDGVFRYAKLPKSAAVRYRRLAIIHTIVCWGLMVPDILIVLYPALSTVSEMSISMAPLGVHIFLSPELVILGNIMIAVVFIWGDLIWFFSHSVNYVS